MQKLLFSIFFISLCTSAGLAQSSDDYNKVEFYGGYSRGGVQPNVEASGQDYVLNAWKGEGLRNNEQIIWPSVRTVSFATGAST